jgi:predicted HAD superfamily phosphohydrolase
LLHDDDFQAIEQLEKTIVTTDSIDDEWIKTKLDTLFMNELPGTNFKPVLTEVRPVGGRYQVEALNKFASIHNKPLSDWLVVGNTVANIEMLQEVNRNGGISIAFNADKNVLPHATLGLASTRVDDLLPVFELWERDNRSELEKFIRNKEKTGGTGNRNHFHLFADTADISAALEVHTKISDIVKEEAAHPE